jgi:hypothetical protein
VQQQRTNYPEHCCVQIVNLQATCSWFLSVNYCRYEEASPEDTFANFAAKIAELLNKLVAFKLPYLVINTLKSKCTLNLSGHLLHLH